MTLLAGTLTTAGIAAAFVATLIGQESLGLYIVCAVVAAAGLLLMLLHIARAARTALPGTHSHPWLSLLHCSESPPPEPPAGSPASPGAPRSPPPPSSSPTSAAGSTGNGRSTESRSQQNQVMLRDRRSCRRVRCWQFRLLIRLCLQPLKFKLGKILRLHAPS